MIVHLSEWSIHTTRAKQPASKTLEKLWGLVNRGGKLKDDIDLDP